MQISLLSFRPRSSEAIPIADPMLFNIGHVGKISLNGKGGEQRASQSMSDKQELSTFHRILIWVYASGCHELGLDGLKLMLFIPIERYQKDADR